MTSMSYDYDLSYEYECVMDMVVSRELLIDDGKQRGR